MSTTANNIGLASSSNNGDASPGLETTTDEQNLSTTDVTHDLPFLVTHWLAHYAGTSGASGAGTFQSEAERQAALARIRQATSEIASAFSTLGAYGSSMRPSFGSFAHSSVTTRNSTYSDVNRQNSGLSPTHLEQIAQSVSLHNATAHTVAMDNSPANLLLKATSKTESIIQKPSTSDERGRTLHDAIVVDDDKNEATSDTIIARNVQLGTNSILQRPALVLRGNDEMGAEQKALIVAERKEDPLPAISVKSSLWDIGHKTATTMRKVLALRETIRTSETEVLALQSSLSGQRNTLEKLKAQVDNLQQSEAMTHDMKLNKIDELTSNQQGCDRVISQLQRKLIDLNRTLDRNRSHLSSLEIQAHTLEKDRRCKAKHFSDPFGSWKGPLAEGSVVGGCESLRMMVGRQYGLSRSQVSALRPMISTAQNGLNPSHFLAVRKHLLESRFSHAITINTHMRVPVYSVHFDRTGRYFITGADDSLIKVFCLGAAQSCRTKNERNGSRRLRCNYGANFRGAVLVCSLRGHAGVINAMDVSSDNCFLATASTDQDVRIWGLRDGSPIAILRGHKNGANMVAWSTLTPFRLVTTASDGFSRLWDVREACLKRYGKFVGKREEYILVLKKEERKAGVERNNVSDSIDSSDALPTDHLRPVPERDGNSSPARAGAALASGPPALPPLPAPGNAVGGPSESQGENNQNESNVDIPAPPLPGAGPSAAENDVNQDGAGQGVGEEDNAPGDFVMNDLIDEGVQLVSKYRHGTFQDGQLQGPGTRSRRAAVNVICVAQSPLGHHFATGSDDGIVRVWKGFEDVRVAVVDNRHTTRNHHVGNASNAPPPASGLEDKPLLKLTGHVSTITDLEYSHAGDRIVSASQKDGVARIWNLASAIASAGADKTVTQIVIKLKDPTSNKPVQPTRRRPGTASNTSGSKVSCDVAVWTHDDFYVITSQCVLLKQGGNEIKPGSQYIFVWLSQTGQCLMGISGAHTMPCNVVLPHPTDSSIICTAADGGCLKVWDLGRGKCLFSHQNKVEYGPMDTNDDGSVDYLDGSFSPDGTAIVLSDSKGQVSIFDCISNETSPSNNGNELAWMRDQYFSNDYYDLFYDKNGYCIETGSKKPPHLAPKSRCAHNGSSFPGADDITETFKKLAGPAPLPEALCRWRREEIRGRDPPESWLSIASSGIRIAVREYDSSVTLLVMGVGHQDGKDDSGKTKRKPTLAASPNQRSNARNLSQRFNYLGYDDLLMREGPDEELPDSEDEEFEPTTSRGRRLNANGDESEEDDIDDMSLQSYEQNHRRRRSRGGSTPNNADERRARAQRRARRNTNLGDFMELDSDDEATEQFMSVNKTANGPYLRDFTREGHLWKLRSLSDATKVHREWLRRDESSLSYFGKKFYAPQVGDSVVYIPRAHYETIKEYPSLSPPWQDWPTDAVWPIVRCSVQNIRYRFPYEDYFRPGNLLCRSVVAIVTLQVTGVPEASNERRFPWPKPNFVEPSASAVFEVSVFENAHEDFILPDFLYTARLESLEKKVTDAGMSIDNLPVDLFYSDETRRGEDLEWQPWSSTITGVQPVEDQTDTHLNDSGFRVLSITGEDGDDYQDDASPWEVNTEGVQLTRPSISEQEESLVLEALNELLEKPDISTYFSMPVDQERYYDYGVMIEVPMDMMFIKRRLRNKYYGSKLSVVADLRLIRDNCIKYNTAENEISKAAIEMCNEFEEKILSPEERSQLISEEEFEKIREDQSQGKQSSNLRIRLSARTIRRVMQASAASASSSSGGTYSLRDRSETRRRSSLENLPAPESNDAADGNTTLRRGQRNDSSTSSGNRRGRHYTLRGQGAGNRTETLARLRAVPSREERAARRNRTDSDQVHPTDSLFTTRSGEINNANTHSHDSDAMPTASGTRRSSRTNTSHNPRYQEPDSSDEDDGEGVEEEEEVEEVLPPATSRTTRSTRTSRAPTRRSRTATRSRSANVDEGDEILNETASEDESESEGDESDDTPSDVDSESEEELHTPSARRSPRSRNTSTSRSSRSTRTAKGNVTNESPGRRSQRSASKRPAYRDVETSDVEEYAEESSEVEEDDVPPTSKSRQRKRVRYAEDSSEAEDESDFENTQRNSNKRKSRGSNAARSKPNKKRKSEVDEDLPVLVPWPEIDLSDITEVTNEVLARVSERDDEGTFALPVVEAYPEVADAYNGVISEPMDLRTIEEERIHAYTSIKQLQDDLILMYRNCCIFNGAGSPLWEYATERWGELNDVFADACKSVNVLLPRRWNP